MTDRWDGEEAGVSEPTGTRRPEQVDDDELLAMLQRALQARHAVPPELVHMAKNVFAWHNIDAELAQLTYDSSRTVDVMSGTRAESACLRALTFTSPQLTIELEVTAGALLGQIVPMQMATVEVQTRAGTADAVASDEIGCFSICPVPSGTFRLHCFAPPAVEVLTGWITL